MYMATDSDGSDKRMSQCVAKFLRSNGLAAQTIRRFEQEPEIAGQLPPECAVRVLGAGDLPQPFSHNGKEYAKYQILEYMIGGDLKKGFDSQRRTIGDKVAMMYKIAKAVAQAHAGGIIHRDLKPSNILLDDAEEPKLADFGVAADVNSPSELTCFGEILGTPLFFSPEQAAGSSDAVCYASDVFSLGTVFYELLAGIHPFQAATSEKTCAAIIAQEPDMLRWKSDDVPRELNAIVMKCLEKKPERRYTDAGELAEDLGRYLQGQRVKAPVHGLRHQTVRWTKRHPIRTVIGAASIALLGFAAYSTWLQGELRQSLRQEYQALAAVTQPSKRSGQCIETLKLIEKAIELYPDAEVPQSLIDEALAALSTTDAVVSQEWEFDQAGFSISPCFRFAARVSQEKDILVCRLDDQEIVCRIPTGNLIPLKTEFSSSGQFLLAECLEKVSSSNDKRVLRIGNVKTGEKLSSVPDHIAVKAYALHPRQEIGAYATYDHSLHWLNLSEDKQQGRYQVNDSISHLCFHPSESWIAMSGNDSVHLFNYETVEELVYPISIRESDSLGDIGWSPDGRLLAIALDERILLIEAATGAQRGLLAGHKERVLSLGFGNRNSLLASYGWDKTMRLWDTKTQQLVLSDSGCDSLQFSEDDSRLAGSNREGRVGYWEIKTPRSYKILGHHRGTIRDWFNVTSGPHGLWASSGPDGAYLFASDPTIPASRLTSLPTSMCLFHPNGKGLFTTHRGMIFFWPFEVTSQNGEPAIQVGLPALYKLGRDDFSRISFDRTGSQLAIASQGAGLQLLSLDDNSECRDIDAINDHHLVTLSPDAHWIATTNPNGTTTRVWPIQGTADADPIDLESGSPLFSPDGNVLLTAKQDEYVFWEVGAWKKLHRISCQSKQLRVGAFANQLLLAALLIDEDRIQVVSSESYRPLLHFRVPGGQPIQAISFAKDDRSLAVTTRGGIIHTWKLDILVEELEQLGISPRQVNPIHYRLAKQISPKSFASIATSRENATSYYPPSWTIPKDRKKWLWDQARIFYRAKLWRESAGLFADYLEVIPSEWVAHLYRGGAQARLGQRAEAKESYRRVVSMGRAKARARDWHSLALLQLRDGDQKNYLSTCRDVFELFHQHENHSDVANALQTCLLASDCGYDFSLLLEQARLLSEEIVGVEWKAFLIGALQYRSGQFQESHDTLKALREEYPDHANPSEWLFHAMACYKLDQRSESQALIQRADTWMANLPKRPAYWGEWEEWLLLRKEMRTLQTVTVLPQTTVLP